MMQARAAIALAAHRDRQNLERNGAGGAWEEQGLVFTTSYGGPLDQTRIQTSDWKP